MTVPAEIVLRLIELTNVEATWLLHGSEPKFRGDRRASADGINSSTTLEGSASVVSLLRSALHRLERGEIPLRESIRPGRTVSTYSLDRIGKGEDTNLVLVCVDESVPEPLDAEPGPRYIAARRDWQIADLNHHCLLVLDDSMSPLITQGAYVAYSDQEENFELLDGKLVVAWLLGEAPVVRWFQAAGRYALLRAENPKSGPSTRLIDLNESHSTIRFRVVSWISTPR